MGSHHRARCSKVVLYLAREDWEMEVSTLNR
jgi:hypothetical protein